MEIVYSVVCFCLLLAFAVANPVDEEGPCFDFNANSYIHFTPNNFLNNGSIHYSLKFRTTQPNGLLLYASGRFGDEEALFIQAGKLTYHLFNTSPTGVEGYFGGFFQTRENVDTGDWITAHVYRMYEVEDIFQRRSRDQTGLVVEIGDQVYRYVDYLERDDISIQPTVYIGGFREPLSETVGFFRGQIKDIREAKNKMLFDEPSLNFRSRVGRNCFQFNPQ
ncbi:uncharacterized protein LOC101858164 [Aplysia californica]|uniref:Uncharacterized protein LOC101858164 n=1 Tax=Aplysia californica TaxID=6500 RepID=A0ABM0JEZ4_APLCA|nr:uncharacterized protein LOC101858164 [Aplysia californica]